MPRTVLEKELQDLDAQIIRLGALVDDALSKALEALETGDLAKSGMVIEADTIIDSLRSAIEEHTIRLLTLQQPLGGRDLRFLTSTLSIVGDLERMGDGAAGIATIILRMSPLHGNIAPASPATGDGSLLRTPRQRSRAVYSISATKHAVYYKEQWPRSPPEMWPRHAISGRKMMSWMCATTWCAMT